MTPFTFKKAIEKAKNTNRLSGRDKINIFGIKVKIYFTSTGRYCIKLKSKLSDENVFKVKCCISLQYSNIKNLSNTENYKVAVKLHRQFFHLHNERLRFTAGL